MNAQKDKLSAGKVVFTIIYLLVFPFLLLLLSGDWFWIEGWLFGIWFLVLCLTTILYLYRKDPELLAERYKNPGEGNQKGWDRYVVGGLVVGFIAWIVIMPLDAKRFGWTTFSPVYLRVLGFIALLFSFFFFFRSYKDNTFLSPLVRIQTERKHQLVSTGVYAIVRHPMYLAAILMFIGAPALLGSCFGIAVGLIMSFLLALRTLGEEKMLLQELEGYEDYKKKVKYRFIPFVW